VLGLSCRGVAVEIGLLSVVASRRGPDCHAENMSRAICVVFLCGPLNCRVGSAVEHTTVVFAGWVAWRRVHNLGKFDTSAEVESPVTLLQLVWTTNGAAGKANETRLSDGRCVRLGS
jgi:hypothetical protein